MDDGFFTNVAIFPAVPMKRAGVRFMLTLHQSLDDIRAFVEAMARRLPMVLGHDDTPLSEVRRAFRLPPASAKFASAPLRLQAERSIRAISEEEWNRCLGNRGSFTWDGMTFLERTFQGDNGAANNWSFHYFIVRDEENQPVLATFFTEAIWKDDMLAPADVSLLAEQRRVDEPDYMTSRMLSMGSLLTEGNHLYLDRTRDWRAAMSLLLDAVAEQAETCDADRIVLRDLSADDPEFDSFLSHLGFTKLPMPESMAVEPDWADDEEFLTRLSSKARQHQRGSVLPWNRTYEMEVLSARTCLPSAEELAHLYQLYLNVKGQSLALNTFDLPPDFFERTLEFPSWELLLLKRRPRNGEKQSDDAVAVVACYIGPEQYVPIVMGLDYRYVRSHGLYRQCLRHILLRAREHGSRIVYYGMGAPLEKRRFGAKSVPTCLYIQTREHYHPGAQAARDAELGG